MRKFAQSGHPGGEVGKRSSWSEREVRLSPLNYAEYKSNRKSIKIYWKAPVSLFQKRSFLSFISLQYTHTYRLYYATDNNIVMYVN
jgi:hypothetical protein